MKFIVLNMFFFGFGVLLIAILILLKRWDSVSRRWFYFSVAVAGYAIGYGLVFSSDTPDDLALLIARLANASAVFIPVTWLNFICSFLGLKRPKLFRILWPVTFILAVCGLTKLAIPSLSLAGGNIRHPEAGPTLYLQTINYFCMVSYSFYLMFRSFLTEVVKERKREILSLILATIFGFIGGASEFSLIYFRERGLDLTFLLVTYPFIMAYVMIKQRVLDIEKVADVFQREKLATVGLLAASINHEIKNPLYAVKGLLETYIENEREGLPHREPLETSERALIQIDHALDVITKLNRFAKPSEETKDSRQKTQANIQEALKDVLDLVSYEFKLDKIKIVNNLDPDLPQIKADQRQLEEILFNLIVNACHAMSARKGDRQEVLPVPFSEEGNILEIRSTMHDSRITVEISDTGTGIPPEQAKHLFEPFHTTKGENGTGLGLYVTKQLVERNGGKIAVKSQEDKGTSFVLEFKAK